MNKDLSQLQQDDYSIDGHKVHYHLDRVYQWSIADEMEDKIQVYPIYVEVSPVGYCNHRCSFCAVDYLGYVNKKIETFSLKNAILSMACNGVRSIMYAGEGEPLLHPDINEIVNWTAKNGIDVGITTNGTALAEKFVLSSLEYCTWVKVLELIDVLVIWIKK